MWLKLFINQIWNNFQRSSAMCNGYNHINGGAKGIENTRLSLAEVFFLHFFLAPLLAFAEKSENQGKMIIRGWKTRHFCMILSSELIKGLMPSQSDIIFIFQRIMEIFFSYRSNHIMNTNSKIFQWSNQNFDCPLFSK